MFAGDEDTAGILGNPLAALRGHALTEADENVVDNAEDRGSCVGGYVRSVLIRVMDVRGTAMSRPGSRDTAWVWVWKRDGEAEDVVTKMGN